MNMLDDTEAMRVELQRNLDAETPRSERTRLGQFSTPPRIARDLMKYVSECVSPRVKIRFLDPAFGTGSLYSALLWAFKESKIDCAVGYEVDLSIQEKSKGIWKNSPVIIYHKDFTSVQAPSELRKKANLIVCNPPYVRHQKMLLDEKVRLQEAAFESTGIRLNLRTGLYGHFMLLAHSWMAKNALAGWLVPGELMDTDYGRKIREYLLTSVHLFRIHRYDSFSRQIKGAMVSSIAVWFRNRRPSKNHRVSFTRGGTLANPKQSWSTPASELLALHKWPRFKHSVRISRRPTKALSDYFIIKRGIATGANSFFILPFEKASKLGISMKFAMHILPKPSEIQEDTILTDKAGAPIVNQKMILVTCNLPEQTVRNEHPKLWEYLRIGIENRIDQRYLCSGRTPWYSQETRDSAPLLIPCLAAKNGGSRRKFRFILNHSKAIATNSYLMLYPKESLVSMLDSIDDFTKVLWEVLNSIPQSVLRNAGREYGGGLLKIEPKELARVPAKGFARKVRELSKTNNGRKKHKIVI
jgi:predicted RNA methylase